MRTWNNSMTPFTARFTARFTSAVSRLPALALALGLGAFVAEPARAQWSQVSDQFYYPARHNWKFRQHYRTADRLFNAFDYGHAILYETLYTKPNADPSILEQEEYGFIT